MVPGSDPGTDIQPFDAFSFQVSASGSYGFVSSAGYDNYTLLYQGAFDSTQPLSNLIEFNDDFLGNNRQSAVAQFLNTNITYIFVNTSYDGSGAFTSVINGPGNVIPTVGVIPAVPEPESLALMLAGMGCIAPMVRRRASSRAANRQQDSAAVVAA